MTDSLSPFSFLDRDGDRVAVDLCAGDLALQAECEALCCEGLLQGLGDLPVRKGHDGRKQFDHRDLCAEAVPDAAQLQADRPGADHDQVLRHAVEREGLGGGDDVLAVEGKEGKLDRNAPHGEDRVLRLDFLLPAAVLARRDPSSSPRACPSLAGP